MLNIVLFDLYTLQDSLLRKTLTNHDDQQAHPVACAAALEVQRIIRDEDLLGNVSRMGYVLERLLKQRLDQLDVVGDIRGRGLFWAIEFVQDKSCKAPFPPGLRFCHEVVDEALNLGLNILGNLGATGEVHVDHVIMSPPYVVTELELERMVGILEEAIATVTSRIYHAREARL